MKRAALFLSVFLCFALSAYAQRAIEPVKQITDYRPVGQTRVWTFIQRDSVVGRLTSTVKETDKVSDSDAVIIAQTLSLDYGKIGQTFQYTSSGERSVSQHGTYLGDDLTLTINNELGQLKLEREANAVSGFYTRAGEKQAVQATVKTNQQALDNNFYDQIEMYLATHGVKVGDTVIDTLFAPLIQLPITLSYTVSTFRYQRLYTQVAESTFVILMAEPEQGVLYFTPDRRLVKIDVPSLFRKVYLDQVSGSVQKKENTSSPTMPNIPKLPLSVIVLATLPHAIAYAIFAVATMLFFAFGHLRKGTLWLALLWGMVAFIPVSYIQTPVQDWVVQHLFIPNVKQGGPIFFWAVFPALCVGLIQSLVVFGTLTTFVSVYKPKAYLAPVLGAALGAGFGLVEGVLTTASLGLLPLVGPHLVERAALILFHTAAGAFLGFGLAKGREELITAVIVSVVINSLLRYLPVFVQAKKVDVNLVYIIYGFVVIGLLAFVWMQLKQTPAEPATRKKQ